MNLTIENDLELISVADLNTDVDGSMNSIVTEFNSNQQIPFSNSKTTIDQILSD